MYSVSVKLRVLGSHSFNIPCTTIVWSEPFKTTFKPGFMQINNHRRLRHGKAYLYCQMYSWSRCTIRLSCAHESNWWWVRYAWNEQRIWWMPSISRMRSTVPLSGYKTRFKILSRISQSDLDLCKFFCYILRKKI